MPDPDQICPYGCDEHDPEESCETAGDFLERVTGIQSATMPTDVAAEATTRAHFEQWSPFLKNNPAYKDVKHGKCTHRVLNAR